MFYGAFIMWNIAEMALDTAIGFIALELTIKSNCSACQSTLDP
jgi:hypothetical protein